MGARKFIGYFKLIEACVRPGCPVCHCLASESRSYLDALLYEQVTDPDTRRALRASWGFCNWHTWMLLEIGNSIFGAAILYEDLVKLVLQRTEELDRRDLRRGWLATVMRRKRRPTLVETYRGRPACPACATATDSENRCLETLVTFIDDQDLKDAYVGSDGLCVPHLFAAVGRGPASEGTATLIELTRAKWKSIGKDIASFVSKHDYRNREPYTEAEAASYRRAFEMLVGIKDVFGNDLHARPMVDLAGGRIQAPAAGAAQSNGNGVPSRSTQEQTP